jgi:hypothetical protein
LKFFYELNKENLSWKALFQYEKKYGVICEYNKKNEYPNLELMKNCMSIKFQKIIPSNLYKTVYKYFSIKNQLKFNSSLLSIELKNIFDEKKLKDEYKLDNEFKNLIGVIQLGIY